MVSGMSHKRKIALHKVVLIELNFHPSNRDCSCGICGQYNLIDFCDPGSCALRFGGDIRRPFPVVRWDVACAGERRRPYNLAP